MIRTAAFGILVLSMVFAQNTVGPPRREPHSIGRAALEPEPQRPGSPASAAEKNQPGTAAESAPATYLLGSGDEISIRVLDADEISDKPLRIGMSGYIRLPLAGQVKASGLTVEQLETDIAARLKAYIKDPEVAVSVVNFRSQPISVIGSVKTPGVYQLQGQKRLIEVLSLAGGLADDAGHTVKITRRLEWGRVPLPNATDDLSGGFSVAEVGLKEIMEASSPAENIRICPQDVISVPRAEMIYVVGDVAKPGGFILRERETLSVLQAVALAGGLDRAASPRNARILRPAVGTSTRAEIAVDLKTIMTGQAGDVAMQPDDILFVPSSAPKRAVGRIAEAAVQITTGLAIYRR